MLQDDSTSKNVLSGFAHHLSANKLLDEQVALDALKKATSIKDSYIDYLIKQKLMTPNQVAHAVATYFGLPFCDVKAFNIELVPAQYLELQLVKKRQVLPVFKKNNLLYLAITSPTTENLYEIKFLTGLDIRLLIVEADKLAQTIDDLLNKILLTEFGNLGSEQTSSTITYNAYKEESTNIASKDAESATVVNYVNSILIDAINKGASDIHFERYEDSYRIRFRRNGVLYPVASPPISLSSYLLARIKVMSNLDITEHQKPQDGRFKLFLSRDRAVDFRVSVCPTLFGEKVVLRILDASKSAHGFSQSGMEPIQQERLMSALQRSQGLILVTGPTGSGKTVTLYSSLHYLNSPEKNISTVEDPVEIPLVGVNQVHVNAATGLTFSSVLRSFLRQDPDIIMLGEIRDLETAEIATKAAQTGHLVLSTLHTNSAPETINRLMNMGIAPYNLASSLTIIVAQRLVRILCELCKQKLDIPEDILINEGFTKEEIGTFQVYGPGSCEHCMGGYKGRSGIYEVMPISKEMAALIMRGGNALEIVEQAKKEGIADLRESGLKKVKLGLTSLAELNRVFK